MAWLESHQEIGQHPKTLKAAKKLGISVPQLVGHLHLLWHWALSYADDGDLSKWDDDDIALGAQWDGDSPTFVGALVDVGFIDAADGSRWLHDWMDYAGRLVRERERKRAARAKPQDTEPPPDDPPSEDAPPPDDGPSEDGTQTGGGQEVDSPRAGTNPTNPTQPTNQTEGASRDKPRSDRAIRLPPDWQPDPADRVHQEAIAAGINLDRELERFRDHWAAQGGQKGRKVDWQATWRNWLRRDLDDKPTANGKPPVGREHEALDRYDPAVWTAR